MTTHTPGPWACTYTSNYAHDYRLTQTNGQPLPINAPANDRSEQRANARLIAAAPELLENLRQLCELLESIGHDCTPSRQAIAKATKERAE